MDVLERLAEKNKKHAELVREENRLAQFFLVNYVSAMIVTLYEVNKAESVFTIGPIISLGSSFVFSALLSSLGGEMVIRHKVRIILLTACNIWFCYYWIWVGDSKASFLPLAVVLIVWKKWFYWKWFKRLRSGI